MLKESEEIGRKFRASLSYKNSPLGRVSPEKRGLISRPNVNVPAVRDPRPQPHDHSGTFHGHSREDVARIMHELTERGKKIRSVKFEIEFDKD